MAPEMPQFAGEYALSETDPAHVRAARKRGLFDKSEGGQGENLITHCGAFCFQQPPALSGNLTPSVPVPRAAVFEKQGQARQGGPRASAHCRADASTLSLSTVSRISQAFGLNETAQQSGEVAVTQRAWHTEQSWES
jgi:hypothetical protein